DDPVSVALERRAELIADLFALTTFGLGRECRVGCKDLALDAFRFFADRAPQRQLPAHTGPTLEHMGARRQTRPPTPDSEGRSLRVGARVRAGQQWEKLPKRAP